MSTWKKPIHLRQMRALCDLCERPVKESLTEVHVTDHPNEGCIAHPLCCEACMARFENIGRRQQEETEEGQKWAN